MGIPSGFFNFLAVVRHEKVCYTPSMITYYDTSTGQRCPGTWYDENLTEGIQAFRAQFGFFRWNVISNYAEAIRELCGNHGIISIVLGSNSTDPLTCDDLNSLLELMGSGDNSHLTVIRFKNALFHPKTAHIVRADGTATAMVGSANFTESALGKNVEAWIETDGDDAQSLGLLRSVADGIDFWHHCKDTGVYQITGSDVVDLLLDQGIICDRSTRQSRFAASRRNSGPNSAGGSRQPRWASHIGHETVLDAPDNYLVSEEEPRMVYRWTKKLSPSDVNRNSKNERNLLSFTKKGVMPEFGDIRHKMMHDASWLSQTVGSRFSESTTIKFDVSLPNHSPLIQSLTIDYVPSRDANQNNYTTSLRWNQWFSEHLRSLPGDGYVGYWITIEKDSNGKYYLTISQGMPNPRSIGFF